MTQPQQRPSLPPAAAAAAQDGNVIEAVKLVREATGLGLKEAKDLVEAWQAGHLASGPVDVLGDGFAARQRTLPPAAQAAAQAGNVIGAIKIVREAERIGLKEAKERVEAWIATQPLLHEQLMRRKKEGRIGLIVFLLVFLFGCISASLFLFRR